MYLEKILQRLRNQGYDRINSIENNLVLTFDTNLGRFNQSFFN